MLEKQGGGEFAFGACTGHIWEASSAEATSIDFSWDGSDDMDEVCGEGEAELQTDGSLQGEIRYRHGDELPFIAEMNFFNSLLGAYNRTAFCSGKELHDPRLASHVPSHRVGRVGDGSANFRLDEPDS